MKTQISVIISVTREMISILKMILSEVRGKILKIHVRARSVLNLRFNIVRSNDILRVTIVCPLDVSRKILF